MCIIYKPIDVAIAAANWFLGHVVAVLRAVFGLLQGRTLAHVSQLDAFPEKQNERK